MTFKLKANKWLMLKWIVRNRTVFVYTQLNVKTVLRQPIQKFKVNIVLMSKTVLIQTIQFRIITQFICKYGLMAKNIVYDNFKCLYKKQSGNLLNASCMYKEDLELNNQRWWICHKTKPNLTILAHSAGTVEHRGVKPLPHNECPWYDTKLANGNVPVMLKLWGMWSTPSLPSLLGYLWPEVLAPNRFLSWSQTERNCVLIYGELNSLK